MTQAAAPSTMMPGSSRWYGPIAGAAHVVLVLFFIHFLDYEPRNDSHRYLHVASEFRELKALSPDPDMNCHTAPGYPLFLAFTHPLTLGNKYLVAVLQSVIFLLCMDRFIRALVGSGWLPESSARTAFTIPLVLPDVIHVNGWLLTESLTTSLLLLVVSGAIAGGRSTLSMVSWVAAGCMLVLNKFEYLVAMGITAAFMMYVHRTRDVGMLALSLATLLMLNGWRNHHLFGRFNPFSFGAGTVIYGGNNLNGDGSWHIAETNPDYLPPHGWTEFRSIDQQDRVRLCVEEDAFYKRMAVEAWERDPALQVRTVPVKFMKLWLLPADLDIYTSDTRFTPGLQITTLFDRGTWSRRGIAKHLIEVILLWTALGMIIVGARPGHHRASPQVGRLLWTIAAALTALYALPFYGLGRFHVPMLVLLSPYIVHPLRSLAERLRRVTQVRSPA